MCGELKSEPEVDAVFEIEKKYKFDLDKKLTATVKALYKVGKNRKLSSDEVKIINLFLSEQRVLYYEFLEIEYYDDEELFNKLGMYAVSELPYNDKELCKEIVTLVKLNKEEFNCIPEKEFNKLLNEIKKMDSRYSEHIDNAENKIVYILDGVQQYVNFLFEKYSVYTSLEITERYFLYKGWKLINGLSKNTNDIIRKQRKARQENYVQMWKYRNMYNSKNKIEIFIYQKMLLSDLKRLERYYRELSMEGQPSVTKVENIVNYYTYTFILMYIANVENSTNVVKDIWSDKLSLVHNIEMHVIKGSHCSREFLKQNKKFPSPRKLVQELGITPTTAEKYGLELLYMDTLSSGTRNRLLSDNKPTPLKIIVKDSKKERINKGKKYLKFKQVNGLNDEEVAEQFGTNRQKVGRNIKEYIEVEYKVKSKGKNFDENEFMKKFAVTKNKIEKLKKH